MFILDCVKYFTLALVKEIDLHRLLEFSRSWGQGSTRNGIVWNGPAFGKVNRTLVELMFDEYERDFHCDVLSLSIPNRIDILSHTSE